MTNVRGDNSAPHPLPQQRETTDRVGDENQANQQAAQGAATHAQVQVARVNHDQFVNQVESAKPGTDSAIRPPGLPPVNRTADEANGAAVLADNLEDALSPVINRTNRSAPLDLDTDMLTKLFMMLNILDPTSSVETQNNLSEGTSNVRELALQSARKEIANRKEQVEEAQKEGKMFGMFSKLMAVVNPLGMISKLAGDSKSMGTLGGVLAPEQMMVKAFGKEEAPNESKLELEDAQQRQGTVQSLSDTMGPNHSKKLEREQQEAFDQLRLETTTVGEDGVPLKTIANKAKSKLADALQALFALGAERGPQAMMSAAKDTFKDALLPVFQSANLRGAEKAADMMAEMLTTELARTLLGGEDNNAFNGIGLATSQLGEALDPDSRLDADASPSEQVTAAHLDALEAMRAFAQSPSNSASRPGGIQG